MNTGGQSRIGLILVSLGTVLVLVSIASGITSVGLSQDPRIDEDSLIGEGDQWTADFSLRMLSVITVEASSDEEVRIRITIKNLDSGKEIYDHRGSTPLMEQVSAEEGGDFRLTLEIISQKHDIDDLELSVGWTTTPTLFICCGSLCFATMAIPLILTGSVFTFMAGIKGRNGRKRP